ncbi:purine/pyrimidine permease [Ornithinibacillus halotolerans]|uniref:Xanthine permease n=1 Tax=Ornithinibacillus halotolerans TaxID=1274357 RepID=A0A916SAB5_9BACI|nr:purine/pyrimidine permease [Ornithinibacillus halotolerans]GGA91572.1 xanthine permease [Ornithinibacillus halotolerans]
MSKSTFSNTAMETLQWFVFLLAGIVALPIVIGVIFEMNFEEIAGLMQRSFFAVGIASLLQGLFGHRLPIVEGPAGLWVSVFAVMAFTGMQNGMSLTGTLQNLMAILIVTGIFLFLFGVFKIAQKLLPIFTPLVTGIFFLLLTVQLSGTFLKGMLGIEGDSSTIQVMEATIAFLTFVLILGLSLLRWRWLKNYAILIGIVIGWIIYILVVGVQVPSVHIGLFSVPEMFAFGKPTFDLSVIPISFILAIIIISNLVASIVAMNQTLELNHNDSGRQLNQGTVLTGINHGLSGVFSVIGNVPLAASSGFVTLTNQKRKAPFLYASILLIIVSFFPPIISFISSIPSPIANAAIMASFIQLVGLGIRNLASEHLDNRKITIIGVAYLVGMGTMFLPSQVFQALPSMMQPIMSNGLLVGTMLAILIEQLWKNK